MACRAAFLQLSHLILKSTMLHLCSITALIPHIPPCVVSLRNMLKREKAHQLFRERTPLLRQRRGSALPLCWGLIAVLIGLFLPNLFARRTDPTAMLYERVYQLKPVVRSTRGLIFSLRNESSPRTQVSRQLETPEPQREITGTHRVVVGFFPARHTILSLMRYMMIGALIWGGVFLDATSNKGLQNCYMLTKLFSCRVIALVNLAS